MEIAMQTNQFALCYSYWSKRIYFWEQSQKQQITRKKWKQGCIAPGNFLRIMFLADFLSRVKQYRAGHLVQANKHKEFTEQALFIDIPSKQFSFIYCQAKMEENLILGVFLKSVCNYRKSVLGFFWSLPNL